MNETGSRTYLVSNILLWIVLLWELESTAVVRVGEVGLLDGLEGVHRREDLEAWSLLQEQNLEISQAQGWQRSDGRLRKVPGGKTGPQIKS